MSPPPRGSVLGHEATGKVHSLGQGVTTDSLGRPLKEGDRVAYIYFYPCGRCYACLKGDPAACPKKQGGYRDPEEFPYFHGAYGEYFYLSPGGHLFQVSDDLSDEMVAPANCALSQVIYGLTRVNVRLGDAVVLQGAGGLGLYACAVAKEMGAYPVISIDKLTPRLELAKDFGADYVINAAEMESSREVTAKARELTGGDGADVVADLVGLPTVIPEGIRMLRNGGRYLEIGTISRGFKAEIDPSILVGGSRSIVGIATYDPWALPEALEFLQRTRDRYPYHRLISHTFPLDQINEAFQQAEWAGKQATEIIRATLLV